MPTIAAVAASHTPPPVEWSKVLTQTALPQLAAVLQLAVLLQLAALQLSPVT